MSHSWPLAKLIILVLCHLFSAFNFTYTELLSLAQKQLDSNTVQELCICCRQKTVNSLCSLQFYFNWNSMIMTDCTQALPPFENILSENEVFLIIRSSASSDLCITSALNSRHQSTRRNFTGKSLVRFFKGSLCAVQETETFLRWCYNRRDFVCPSRCYLQS